MTMYEQYQDTLTDALWRDITSTDRGDFQGCIAVIGNTYPHRRVLSAMGGKWDSAAKAWRVPALKLAEVRKLRGVEVA